MIKIRDYKNLLRFLKKNNLEIYVFSKRKDVILRIFQVKRTFSTVQAYKILIINPSYKLTNSFYDFIINETYKTSKEEFFISFLKKNKCYRKFFKNLNGDCADSCKILETLLSKTSYDLLFANFFWSFSPEGCGYWDKIYTKWEDTLYNL